MLFSTLNQVSVFFIFIYYGLLLGIIFFIIFNLIKKLYPINIKSYFLNLTKPKNTRNLKITKKQKINIFLYNLFLIILIIFICVIFYLITYLYNFGIIRLFCVSGFLIGFIFAKIILSGIKKLIIKIKVNKIKKIINH